MGKVKITTWVEQDVATALQRLSDARGSKLSRVSADLLERAITAESDSWSESLIVPIMEEVIRKEVHKAFNRIAKLLVRFGLEAGTSRRLAVHLLAVTTNDSKGATNLNEQYWKRAADALRSTTSEVPELVAAVTTE